jgi:hypothetical protein
MVSSTKVAVGRLGLQAKPMVYSHYELTLGKMATKYQLEPYKIVQNS